MEFVIYDTKLNELGLYFHPYATLPFIKMHLENCSYRHRYFLIGVL